MFFIHRCSHRFFLKEKTLSPDKNNRQCFILCSGDTRCNTARRPVSTRLPTGTPHYPLMVPYTTVSSFLIIFSPSRFSIFNHTGVRLGSGLRIATERRRQPRAVHAVRRADGPSECDRH